MRTLTGLLVAAGASLLLQGAPALAQSTPPPLTPAQVACVKDVSDRYFLAMEAFSVADPRFGLAWREYVSALHEDDADAVRPGFDVHAHSVAVEAARERFIDRVLRTARPETIEYFNFAETQVRAQAASCVKAAP